MKLTHRSFGEVNVKNKRTTTGGNEVYDATDKNKVVRALLTDKRYWEVAQ